MAGLKSGACTQGCGCQTWHKPEDSDSKLCDGCMHHLCYHSLGIDTCKWQLLKRDDEGEPVQGPDGLDIVLKRCKCSKWFNGNKKLCDGCCHHVSYHVALPHAKKADSTSPPQGQSSRQASRLDVPACSQDVHEVAPQRTKDSANLDDVSRPTSSKVEELNPEWVKAYAGELSCLSTSHSLFQELPALNIFWYFLLVLLLNFAVFATA